MTEEVKKTDGDRKLDEWERLARLLELSVKIPAERIDPENAEMLSRLRIDMIFARSTILRARSNYIMFEAAKRAGKPAEFEEAGGLLLSLGRAISLAGKIGAVIRKNPDSKLANIVLVEGLAREELLSNGGREVKLCLEKSFFSVNTALKAIRGFLAERLMKKKDSSETAVAESTPEQKKDASE